jgi:Methyltransferase domain
MADEWLEWHRGYEGPGQLSKRLVIVQELLRDALTDAPAGPLRVLSLCAGDGRDLLGVLPTHARRGDVRARLVELQPELVAAGRQEVDRHGLTQVEFVERDASNTSAAAGFVPADIILVCGVFGNLTDTDVERTIRHLPELCASRASVIWTRGRFAPDLTPAIRGWFRDAGFAELAFVPIPDTTASVGAHRLERAPAPFRPDVRLFTFLPKEKRPSTRAAAARQVPGVRTRDP